MGRLRVPKVGGRFPARYHLGVDPGLTGVRAFEHPAVQEWHRWLLEEWEPVSTTILLTPCSNVKPYTRSPTSRKIVGALRRLGLWDGTKPRIDWVFLSDLLLLVPYERVEEYPACCYELHPEELLASRQHYELVVSLLSRLIESKLASRHLILFLPKRHLAIWEEAYSRARLKPRIVTVKYTIFSTRQLEEALRVLLGSRQARLDDFLPTAVERR